MLTRVTITGADDAVDPKDLVALQEEFPFVEWAFLLSYTRKGQPRYPTKAWLDQAIPKLRSRPALHLCGSAAREAYAVGWATLKGFARVQINGYRTKQGMLEQASAHPELEFILQVRELDAIPATVDEARWIGMNGGCASLLWDPSGGKGQLAQIWPTFPDDIRHGFAGGIGPDNVTQVLNTIGPRTGSYWIDMESRVRDDNNQLDLRKVRRVLEQAKPYI